MTTPEPSEIPEPEPAERCPECRRIVGIGCACGLTFAEKMRGLGLSVPRGFGAR